MSHYELTKAVAKGVYDWTIQAEHRGNPIIITHAQRISLIISVCEEIERSSRGVADPKPARGVGQVRDDT